MTIKTQSKSSVFNETESGTKRIWSYYPEPYGPIQTPHTIETVRIVTDSRSSNAAFTKKKILVPYKPKRGKTVSPPTVPTLHLPFEPMLFPQRPNQSKRSYDRVCLKHEAKLRAYEQKVIAKKKRHALALSKYENRLKAYDLYLLRMKYGVQRTIRVKTENTRNLPWNPYSRETSYLRPLLGSYYYEQTLVPPPGYPPVKETLLYTGYLRNFPTYPPNWSYGSFSETRANAIAAATSKALTRLHQRLGEQSVHIGNLIAERQQTLGMITSKVKTLVRILTKFSWKRIGSEALGLLSVHKNKRLANETLEFLFGIKPLMSDIYEAVEQFKKEDDGSSIVIIRASAKSTDNVSETVKIVDSETTENTTLSTDSFTSTVTVRVAYVLQYEISSDLASALQRWGLVNPAEILWEVTPWSFVIDWIWPLGDYIRSFTSDIGLRFVQGSKVTTITVNHQVKRNYDSRFNYSWASGFSNGSWSSNYVSQSKVREILTSAPKAQFPSIKSPISVYHIIESLALLRQKLRR